MASPRTIILGGNGTSVATYELPAEVFQYVQSVLVNVTNGGADARPTLFVETNNGQVIATKRQGEPIPAGDTGSATWALRLDDERAAATPVGSGWVSDFDNTGVYGHLFFSGDDGQGNGFWLTTATVAGRILLDSVDGDVELRAGRDINEQASGDILRVADNDIDDRTANGRIRFRAGTYIYLNAATGPVILEGAPDTQVQLQAGGKCQVLDSGGNPIFEVRDDGSLHGKTGESLTFDL